MWNRHNVHKMFINIYRNPKTRNWFRCETFIHLWVKGFSTWGGRDTIFLCWLLLHRQLSPSQRAAPVAHKFAWPRPALNLDSLVRRQELNWLLFLKSQNPQPTLPVRDVIHIPWSQFPIWDFHFDISEWHILSARAWTPALMLHLTNPCTKRKVLIQTKPKGKIYKTKSLRHYITCTEKVQKVLRLTQNLNLVCNS